MRCTSYTIAALLCILLYLKPFSNRNASHFLSSSSCKPTAAPEAVGHSPLVSSHQLLLHPDPVVFACDHLVPANGCLSVRSAVSAVFHAGTDMLTGRVGPPDVLPTHIYMYGTHPPDSDLIHPVTAPNLMEAFVVSAYKAGRNFSLGNTRQPGVVDYSFNFSIA